MDEPLPPAPVKALIAPARHGRGTTLYTICVASDGRGWEVHEQLADGTSVVWPESPLKSAQMAETAIFRWNQSDSEPRA